MANIRVILVSNTFDMLKLINVDFVLGGQSNRKWNSDFR